jgi:hypothetical protein
VLKSEKVYLEDAYCCDSKCASMESSSYHLFIVVHPSTAYHTSIVAHHARHTHTHRHAHPHREQRHSSISALQAKLTKSTVAHRRSFRLQPPLQLEERGRPDVVRRSSGRQPPQNKNHMYEFLCRKIVTSSLHYQNQDQCLLFTLAPTNLKQTYCSGF